MPQLAQPSGAAWTGTTCCARRSKSASGSHRDAPGAGARTTDTSVGSRQSAVRRRIEPERAQTGTRLATPALAESEQAVEPVRAVEMHAVAIREVKRRDPADWPSTSRALPMRQALAVLRVP